MNEKDKVPYVVSSKSYTAVAINCAAKAGEWIKSRLGTVAQLSTKTSAQDLVTEVDKGAEQMIRKLILTHFPDHAILGEEGVEPGPEASAQALEAARQEEYLWIIDPVDGTTNFVHGFPFFSVSIALVHRGEVIVGVIYDPSRDELFVAEKGKGAYVHGNPTEVSKEEKLSSSLIATGFPVETSTLLPQNMAALQALVPKVRNVRAGGSAALHMAYVAAGRLSGFWEVGLNAWDIAAGSLLIQESGGTVTDLNGRPYELSVRNVVATNGRIHNAILDVMKEASTGS
ncbi:MULTISPECIES: inositol monophosphatase family protein [Paenibacillus]|uniref:Inositol-1-monophosphatase n=1 Tax=Paenibacillus campinasensis TaxID=66347 RepID=A0A268EQZ8_9BACL|nr:MULTISPECIES: inositol monophosphatase family protein [Paenibacillus]PAD75538.1 inositol monophosphatase [Paenibacillus campinasensis]PAK51523.1 inositol monophosphatase [Paenibacillus sp. 7541]